MKLQLSLLYKYYGNVENVQEIYLTTINDSRLENS